MTQRERMLATIVGVLVVALGVFFVGWKIYSAFALRDSQILGLQKQLSDEDLKIKRGMRSGELLQQYANIALPGDPDVARTIYRDWLVETVTRVGLKNSRVTMPQAPRKQGDVFTVHTYSVVGEGNIEQLVDLLYDVYGAEILHRVAYFKVAPLNEKKDLNITLTMEALSMPGAPDRHELPATKIESIAGKDRETFRELIAGRNVFAPENQPPSLKGDATLVAYRGQRFEYSPEAEDPDKLDKVKFEADVSKLPGAEFSSSSGRLEWTPKENGEYEITVLARDDGFPSREVTRTVKISVKDPPPSVARPTFNVAKHAYITGVTESNGEPEVWVLIRTEGRTLRLNIGESFKIGDMEGKIAEVDGHRVVIDAGGERITTRLGHAIVE